MNEVFYTHAMWRVLPGREAEFIATWMTLADVFGRLPDPPVRGTLLQSAADPLLFYSFGPWNSWEAIEAMRADPRSQAALRKIMALCVEATPGTFHVVADIRL